MKARSPLCSRGASRSDNDVVNNDGHAPFIVIGNFNVTAFGDVYSIVSLGDVATNPGTLTITNSTIVSPKSSALEQ